MEFAKADFGLSTSMRHDKKNPFYIIITQGKGTLHYAAPEHLEKKKYNSKVDIYSLGYFHAILVNFTEEALLNAIKLLRREHKLPQTLRH